MKIGKHARFVVIFCLVFCLGEIFNHNSSAITSIDPSPPEEVVKLIFLHHSVGENWLTDDYGELGLALQDNNYFVSDTYYGWGPDGIGDQTDILDWPKWFTGPKRDTYMDAVYHEYDSNAAGYQYYTRTLTDPGGENEIVMFKSCYPNSEMGGDPDDIAAPGTSLTVASAKYVYNQLLTYFVTKPDKLFIVITTPPMQYISEPENARAFNNWLVNDWLVENSYPLQNVAIFDFYNILTHPENHHRYNGGVIEHITTFGTDTLYYDSSGDDHPNAIGSQKATYEFIDMINIFYNRWKASFIIPETPVGIKASDGKFQDRIWVSWQSVPNTTDYRVYRATSPAGSKALITTVSENNYMNKLSNYGSALYYFIKACNPGGCSGFSTYDSGFVSQDSTGLYFPDNGYFRLRLSNSAGRTDVGYKFGPLGLIPIIGDWDGDGLDTPGVYDPTIGYFRLRNSNNAGNPQVAFQYGPPNWIPIAGDWNGDGIDTIGIYNPATRVFKLRNSNSSGAPDVMFQFGPVNQIPIVGDWNNNGTDTIGVYDELTGYFRLRFYNSGGNPNISFQFGPSGMIPIIGDWDNDGKDTVGVYDPSIGYFRLKNTNEAGPADLQFRFGPLGWISIGGDWDNQ